MNKFIVWRALARGVILEAIRRKDLWVVAILGFIIVCSAGTLGFFGMSGLESFAKDLATTVLGGFSTILAIVTTGQIPPNPSELLMHERFGAMLRSLEQQCDVLIVDAPPVLAVSDAAIIGRLTGATLMVVRAGRHPMGELEQAVKRLAQGGVDVKGFVFNGLDLTRQRHRFGQHGYHY